LAIELNGDGVTANDLGDDDLGPNNLQNYPLLTSAVTVAGETTIRGTLNSNSEFSYRIEFFSNAALDPSGYGEGENYLGFVNVTTDVDGDASFAFEPPTPVPVGQFITTTATRLDEETLEPVETSEFSLGVIVTATAAASADFDNDGDADGADFLTWQRGVGLPAATHAQGDADGDADVDAADLAAWKADFGAVAASTIASVSEPLSGTHPAVSEKLPHVAEFLRNSHGHVSERRPYRPGSVAPSPGSAAVGRLANDPRASAANDHLSANLRDKQPLAQHTYRDHLWKNGALSDGEPADEHATVTSLADAVFERLGRWP
jgi:hypothetical protein